MSPQQTTIRIRDALDLRYAVQGDRNGPTMILLHGVTDSWRSFELVLPHLPPNVHVIALSQRGHGDSDRPDSGYHLADLATDVTGLMDGLEIQRAILVGHSMGSSVAACCAAARPERVAGLVLVAAFASYADKSELKEFWRSQIAEMTDPVDSEFVRAFQQSTVHQPVPHDFFEAVVTESMKVPARVWRAAFAAFFEDEVVAAISKIKAPTRMIWGAHDALVPESDQKHLLTALPGSQLITFDESGHAPHWEEPERFAQELVNFARALGVIPGECP